MLQDARSAFGAESNRQSRNQISASDSMDFARGIVLSSGRVTGADQRKARRSKAKRSTRSSIEMKVWAVLFVLTIFAAIALIVAILLEESASAQSSLSYRAWIASSLVPI